MELIWLNEITSNKIQNLKKKLYSKLEDVKYISRVLRLQYINNDYNSNQIYRLSLFILWILGMHHSKP